MTEHDLAVKRLTQAGPVQILKKPRAGGLSSKQATRWTRIVADDEVHIILRDDLRRAAMPWHVAKSSSCPESRPWAVIKDADGEVEGCHATEADAQRQLAALYANEPPTDTPQG